MRNFQDAIDLNDLMPLDREPQEERSHLIPCNARELANEKWRALCGALVPGHTYARNGIPTCPDCARIDEDEVQSLMRITTWRQV